MRLISAASYFCFSCLPLGAVDLVLGHFEYQIDYQLVGGQPDEGWATSISYDLDGSFADDEGIVRLDQSGVRLLAAPSTKVVTSTPPAGFGQANEPIWILSQNNIPGELFLGWRAVYPQGIFQANVNGNYTPSPLGSISSELTNLTGTGKQRGGEFAMWFSSGFGSLEFHYNSTDGIDSADLLNPIPSGSHSHYNWGFTKPGTYAVTFRNEGRLNPQNGGADTSSETTLHFIIPHEGFLRGSGQWRLGSGAGNSPAVAIYDRENQVDYASDQVVLIASSGLAPCHLRDLAEGLQQQMFFWGQDVICPGGNQLVREGFERLPSKGLKGTRCYRREWQNGHLELYGSCAGWYGPEGGFAFIRPRKRVVVWTSSESTPVPGLWQPEFVEPRARKEELHAAALPFLDWLISYETTILNRSGVEYREEGYRRYQKVPKATAWLPPETALPWFTCFRDTPDRLVRPRKMARKNFA